ncbi:MAG: hypothetical protein UV09_C0012G0005 [Candidatus Gottesmanbacteria bacterium GW2011_GWA2_42_18]|uniref:Septum formation initiator n=2 Tax=Candidatus Gottesmaniibacteriota TaxID=1752720 RepID=A0A0G1BKN2_9BACT|nr:MAG: hypothetical protein UV09_C0012G0005 [Candidatus Gottesmanbacteria bacterium GW2011_GWA2_42_18]KKS74622.1 MAG: hypothetical protein UV46_C0039G0004 [Candidatus Gottesmanbacteria bacterium GW2011_GWC2_42_8]
MDISCKACQVESRMPAKQHKINYRLLSFILLALFFSFYALKSWINLQERLKIVKTAEEKVLQENENKASLEKELVRVQGRNFIEQQARDKLNLGKDEEITVILPTLSVPSQITPTPIDNSYNWEKWLKLFL